MKLQLNQIYNIDCMIGFKDIADNEVDMVLTDIPYGEVNRHHTSDGIRSLDKGVADVLTFNLHLFAKECVRVCKGSIYIFCGTEQVSELRRIMDGFGLSTRHCIWEKSNPSPLVGEHMWLSSFENCIFARKRNATFNEHCKSSVWKFPVEVKQKHPTQKSIKLFKYLIKASSNPGDLILDPCMGSGTTAFAALKLDRKVIGFEMNSTYCKMANRRIDMERRQIKLWEV